MSGPEKRQDSVFASLEAHIRQNDGADAEREHKSAQQVGPESSARNKGHLEHTRPNRELNSSRLPSDMSKNRKLIGSTMRDARGLPGDGHEQQALLRVLWNIPARTGEQQLPPLPPLPQFSRKLSRGTHISFLLFVVIPLVMASIYYTFFAPNQYAAEFRFAVQQTSSSAPSIDTAIGGIASILGGASSSVSTENYMVVNYLTSRQIVDELEKKIHLVEMYSRPSIDWWARFNTSAPIEKFVSYWKSMVSADYDQVTGIATVQVRAFSPHDAYLIATTMVSLAENLVNQIAMRSKKDAVRFASEEVKRAQDRLNVVQVRLRKYRDKQAVIDPTTNVVASNTALAQTLRSSLLQYQTELAMLRKQNIKSDAPSVIGLEARISAAKQQLAGVEGQVATAKAGTQPLSNVVGEYEKLKLEQQVAQTILTNAIQALEQARVNASTQQLYVTPFVRPSIPQSSTYPNRIEAIVTVGLSCLFLWAIGLLLAGSIREHLR